MNALIEQFDLLATSTGGIAKLRELILSLAVRGQLVQQDRDDEPASELLKKIHAEKDRLIAEGKIKRDKPLAEIGKDEKPYELPVGWAWSSLAQIGLISPRNDAADDLATSFVQMSSIPARFGESHLVEERAWRDIKSGFTHFSENDVGVAKITPCFENGKSTVFRGLTNGIGAGTTELHIVRPIGGTLPDYILLFLKTPDFLVAGEQVMTGSAGQKRLPRQYFESTPFPLPPLAEQSRIVAKVEELMALCDRLEAEQGHAARVQGHWVEAALDQLAESADADEFRRHWQHLAEHFDSLFATPESIERLNATLLQLAVRGKLVPQDPNDEPASELLKQIRAEKDRLILEGKIKRGKPLPPITEDEKPYELPEGWEWARFADVVNIASNLVKPDAYLNWQQVAPDCIEKGTGNLIARRSVREAGIVSPNHLFFAGQILYSKIRPSLSKAVLVDFEGLCSADMYPLDAKIDTKYLLRVILSTTFLEQVVIAENRVKMPKLNQDALNGFVVPLPPLAEQSRIVTQVEKLLALTAELKARLSTAQTKQAHLAETLIAEVC